MIYGCLYFVFDCFRLCFDLACDWCVFSVLVGLVRCVCGCLLQVLRWLYFLCGVDCVVFLTLH